MIVFILFGGSGCELDLCKELGRNFIRCEIHPAYHKMILGRIKLNGEIKDEYRLPFLQKKKQTNHYEKSAQMKLPLKEAKTKYTTQATLYKAQ